MNVVTAGASAILAARAALFLQLPHIRNGRDGMRVVMITASAFGVSPCIGEGALIAEGNLHAHPHLLHVRIEIAAAANVLPAVVADDRRGMAPVRTLIPRAIAARTVEGRVVIAIVETAAAADKQMSHQVLTADCVRGAVSERDGTVDRAAKYHHAKQLTSCHWLVIPVARDIEMPARGADVT